MATVEQTVSTWGADVVRGQVHPTMAQALAPFAPPSSVVHQIVRDARELSAAECAAIDTAMHADKMVDGYGQRNYLAAMVDQMRRQS